MVTKDQDKVRFTYHVSITRLVDTLKSTEREAMKSARNFGQRLRKGKLGGASSSK